MSLDYGVDLEVLKDFVGASTGKEVVAIDLLSRGERTPTSVHSMMRPTPFFCFRCR